MINDRLPAERDHITPYSRTTGIRDCTVALACRIKRKGLKKSQHIPDHMGSSELAANIFRAAQTEEKIRREGISGKDKANRAHKEVDSKVRQTIKELGGTMPEDQPTPKTSVRQLETKRKKLETGKAAGTLAKRKNQ